MFKKKYLFAFLLITSLTHAQFTVNVDGINYNEWDL